MGPEGVNNRPGTRGRQPNLSLRCRAPTGLELSLCRWSDLPSLERNGRLVHRVRRVPCGRLLRGSVWRRGSPAMPRWHPEPKCPPSKAAIDGAPEQWLRSMSAMVSVIIPTFDRPHSLGESVDSALAQFHSDVEAILVDDGSTDDTRELMTHDFDDPRIRYHYQAQWRRVIGAQRRARSRDWTVSRFPGLRRRLGALAPEPAARRSRSTPEAGMIWTDTEFVDGHGTVVSSSALPSSSLRIGTSRSMISSRGPHRCRIWVSTSRLVRRTGGSTSAMSSRRW